MLILACAGNYKWIRANRFFKKYDVWRSTAAFGRKMTARTNDTFHKRTWAANAKSGSNYANPWSAISTARIEHFIGLMCACFGHKIKVDSGLRSLLPPCMYKRSICYEFNLIKGIFRRVLKVPFQPTVSYGVKIRFRLYCFRSGANSVHNAITLLCGELRACLRGFPKNSIEFWHGFGFKSAEKRALCVRWRKKWLLLLIVSCGRTTEVVLGWRDVGLAW